MGEWKLVLIRLLSSICIMYASSTTSSRLPRRRLVNCVSNARFFPLRRFRDLIALNTKVKATQAFIFVKLFIIFTSINLIVATILDDGPTLMLNL